MRSFWLRVCVIAEAGGVRLASLTGAMLIGALAIGSCASSSGCGASQQEVEAEPKPHVESVEPTPADPLEALEDALQAAAVGIDAGEQAADRRWETLRGEALDPTVPLPGPVRQALDGVQFDPRPDSLTRDTHYWVSNENHHHLFRSALQDHGGIYLGVGTDQNYLMAAWAEAPILLLMDFDEQIRNVHHLYGAMFERADTPRQFLSLWGETSADEISEWIAGEYDDERVAQLRRTFEVARQTIFWRLRTTADEYEERQIPTFLTDQNQYEFVRDLFLNDRVFPIRGDLTGDVAMVDIASALEQFDLQLGVVYVSNAEQYFDFTPTYRRNVVAQPFGDESLFLRTRPMSRLGLPEEGDYHYNVQKAQNFARWMSDSRILNSARLLIRHQENADTDGLSHIRRLPKGDGSPPDVADIQGEE